MLACSVCAQGPLPRAPAALPLIFVVLSSLSVGIINDLESTIDSIVSAADLPLSILIVGVGNADFSQMEALDSDKRKLRSRGRIARRDIVQFVAMRDFMVGGQLTPDAGAAVSRALLAEVPGQLLSYMEQVSRCCCVVFVLFCQLPTACASCGCLARHVVRALFLPGIVFLVFTMSAVSVGRARSCRTLAPCTHPRDLQCSPLQCLLTRTTTRTTLPSRSLTCT